MSIPIPIDYETLSKTCRYTDGVLEKLVWGSRWKKVDTSAANTSAGYKTIRVGENKLFVHRVIYVLANKCDLSGALVIDHIDGNPLNNDPNNLRAVTTRENLWNRQMHRDGRLQGCYYEKARGRWRAQDQSNYEHRFLGYFDTEQEAHAAFMSAIKRDPKKLLKGAT